MTSNTGEDAFEIFWDTEHLGDDDYDAELIRFTGWEYTTGLISTRDLELPDKIYFEANFNSLLTIDYPVNDVNWPICSQKMLEVLHSVGEFEYRKIPVIMLDDTVSSEERFDSNGNPKPEVMNEDFVAVQLLEHATVFDWEKSEYEPHKRLKDRASRISKFVIKKPEEGLPPLFRVSANPKYLLVSAEAKHALEEVGVRGVLFWGLDKIKV